MTTEQTTISSCCVTGHIHEGSPQGSFEILHGIRTYISDQHPPKDPSAKQNVIVVLPDVFGVDVINAKLVADEWAGRGWKVLMPDVLEGDAIPIEHLKTTMPNPRDKAEKSLLTKAADTATTASLYGPWLLKHREAVAKPIIENFVKAIKADPSTGKIAGIGFCWGGRYVCLLSQPNSPAKLDVAIAYHPSFLVKSDVEPITSTPVAILKGTVDDIMDDNTMDQLVEILKKNLGDEKVLSKKYEGAVHGFAIRNDDMIEKEKKQKEEAAQIGMDFVAKWFGE